MKLFYIPITNRESVKNYTNTIKERVNYKKETVSKYTNNLYGVWGFKTGKSNMRNYNLISEGDIVFFRTNDEEKYECFDGFGRVIKKEINKELSKNLWNDFLYENIIFIDKLVIFDKPFRLSKNKEKLLSLNFGNMWHNGYDMFREWQLKEKDLDIKIQEDLVNYFYKFSHKVFYDINKMNEVVLEINEDIRTEREAFFKERIGQSLLKEKLLKEKRNCELCGINKKELLIASHIKPWSESNDVERLDINNVLLLCPTHDKLFDKGYISFKNDGKIIISDELDEINRTFSNVNSEMKITIKEEQKKYLEYHRKEILKKSSKI